MKTAAVLALFFVIAGIAAACPFSAENTAFSTAAEIADSILSFKMNEQNAKNLQELVDGELAKNAGVSSEWYIIGLSGYADLDFSSYEKSLVAYLDSHEMYSATARQRCALTLLLIGSSSHYIGDFTENSIGQQGIMSYVFGLHLLNNGCVSSAYTKESLVKKILSMRLSDGGWAVTGTAADVDVTAMTLCALAPYYRTDEAVKNAVEDALSLLSSRQLSNGGFMTMGTENAESTAQVITALSCLGIDPASDSRFVKSGKTLFGVISEYRLADGSLSHVMGEESNATATVQAFYTMVAYMRMCQNKGSLYLLDRQNTDTVQNDEKTESDNAETPAAEDNPQQENRSDNNGAGGGINQIHENSQKGTEKKIAETVSPEKSTDTTETQPPKKDTKFQPVGGLKDGAYATPDETNEENTVRYKPIAVSAAVLAALIIAAALFILKKRHPKNFIAVGVVTAGVILFLLLTDFQSKEAYQNDTAARENPAGAVTMSISCETILEKEMPYFLPEDGVILEETTLSFEDGETAYDILVDAAKEFDIQIDNTGASGAAYIAGIDYLYEFDYGELSGWMYFVNGEAPSVGCDNYFLKDGDRIEWKYTCDIGKDL